MKYQTGEIGRVTVVRFDDGDKVLQSLIDIAKKENIRAGVVHVVGGMKNATIVVGPEKDELPPRPVWREFEEGREVIGIGTIFWYGDEPKIHLHGAFGKRDAVWAGCLREKAETFLVLEAIIMEIKGVNAVREFDPAMDAILLKL